MDSNDQVPSRFENEKETEVNASWQRVLGTAGAVILGTVLLVAAWAKAIEPLAFIRQIRIEGLDFLLSAQMIALIALGLEVWLGVLLVMGVRRLWVMIPAAVLVAFFLFLTGRNYWMVSAGLRPADSSCGCFGTLIERTPAEAFWQDLLLLMPSLLLAFWGPTVSRSLPTVRLFAASIAALAVIVFTLRNPDLPYAELATRPPVDMQLEDFQPVEDYALLIEDHESSEARIYYSEPSATFLISAPELPHPLLLKPKENTVEAVVQGEVRPGEGGDIDLAPGTLLVAQGEFSIVEGAVTFQIDGRTVKLTADR